MNKEYQCKKCGNIYTDRQSDKFVKTMIKKCPVCGSFEVVLIDTIKVKTKGFVKKIIK